MMTIARHPWFSQQEPDHPAPEPIEPIEPIIPDPVNPSDDPYPVTDPIPKPEPFPSPPEPIPQYPPDVTF
jgi:hypothetical protein